MKILSIACAFLLIVLASSAFALDDRLLKACQTNDISIIKQAIDNGANPYCSDAQGNTPLHIAAMKNSGPEIVTLLLSAGSSPLTPNKLHNSPLSIYITKKGNPESIAILQKIEDDLLQDNPPSNDYYEENIESDKEFSPNDVNGFLQACISGNISEIDMYISAGMNVNARGKFNNTALIESASVNQIAAVELLLKLGAKINMQNSAGVHALQAAIVKKASPELVALLIKNGADLERRTSFGETPLSVAAGGDSSELVSLLLKSGAKASAPGHGGNTPIENALQHTKNAEIIDILVRFGADLNAKSAKGLFPLLLAAANNPHAPVVLHVLQRTQDKTRTDEEGIDAAMYAAARNNVEVITALYRNGFDIHRQSIFGQTALALAVTYNENARVIEALMKLGANLHVKSKHGLTPVMIAADQARHPDILRECIRLGANVKEKTPGGKSVLELALKNPKLAKDKVIEELRQQMEQ